MFTLSALDWLVQLRADREISKRQAQRIAALRVVSEQQCAMTRQLIAEIQALRYRILPASERGR